ncbi:E3 binding domain-containing protein [Mesorhizobium yinganensis]|uniref:E3 binding domain-containing protein n=1 Tax=Mesorhizobium yinganensis TaxID=3157707 RepID=UPI0032B773A5
MAIAIASAPPSGRIRATPYARRLARERGLSLSAITGSGPNGRITGDDLINFRAPQVESVSPPAPAILAPVSADPAPAIAEPLKITVAAAPSAIVARVDFSALEALLSQVRELRPDVSREDICLKAAAVASGAIASVIPDKALVLLTASGKRRRFNGLADASLSAIAKLRLSAGEDGAAAFAVSFLGRAGIRPVAARLIDDGAARLVIGAEEKDGFAECLLGYDPARVDDESAEEFLAEFRDLVETPFRLLV